ncbi:MAG: DUF4294 domain-containing protein [Muribaculaceae bacterium]|nr:DUF4294 domain-containing protein [Muribaculaceae bacterium]
MKRFTVILFTLVVTLMAAIGARAQDAVDRVEVPSSLQKVFAGYYHFIEKETGDTLMMLVFNNITIYPRERFRNKKEEEFYWKTVRDVKRTLPYAKLISATLLETYEYIDTYKSQKEKQAYLQQFEKEIFRQYKPVMKKMTKGQGKMLIKLINRETNQNSYSIVKAFLGTFRAGFWQTFGRFFGVSLKQGYHPNKNKDDAMIERICVRVEQGTL